MKLRHTLPALMLALGLPLTAQAVHKVDSLELDSPTPAAGEKVLASGTCHREDASVQFFYKQHGKVRGFETKVDMQQGEFDALLDLGSVNAENGIAWITAKCSDGKTLTTAVKIGAISTQAGGYPVQTSPLVEEAESAGFGYSSGPLVLRGKPRVGGQVGLHGKCRRHVSGHVDLLLLQNGHSTDLSAVAFATGIPFNALVTLEPDQAEAGPAHFVAVCPNGRVLTAHATIAEAKATGPED